jgi:nucleotide-binding universal stress UspA family protein
MYDDILVPTDGSDHARRAAEHAGVLARRFDATVHLLAVLDVQAAAGPFSAGGIDEQFVERLQRTGDVWLDTAEQSVGDTAVTRDTERGEPAKVILSYAEDHDADLVVMGTHGRRGVRRYVSGSVTERVVQRATEAVVERAEAAGVEAVTAVREDSPVPGLLAYADEAGVDLLVVGTHGRRGVTDAVLGSTAERILRRAERPVLTVRPTDEFVGGVD